MALRKPRARRGSPLYMTPALELLPKSQALVKKNLRIFSLLYAFPLLIGLSNGFWVVDSERHFTLDTLDAGNAVGVATLPAYAYGRLSILFLLALAIAVIFKIMLQAAQLRIVESHSVSFGYLWKVVKSRGVQMFWLYLTVTLITIIWLLPALLFRDILIELACFIPVALMLRRFFVAPYLLLDKPELGVWGAMAKSAAMTSRDPYNVYTVIGAMALFALFGIIPLFGWIIAFLLLFFYSCAPAIRYLELKRLDRND